MSVFQRWIRVQDEHAQYDHPEGHLLPAGVELVENYPVHVGTSARPGKVRVAKDGQPVDPGEVGDYTGQTKGQLLEEIERRKANGRVIEPEGKNKADLVVALQVDDSTSDVEDHLGANVPHDEPVDEDANQHDETGDAGEGDE